MAGDASWAFSLPNTNVPVGQALQGLVEDKKQQDKINYQNQVEAQRLQQKQLQENRQVNLNTIDKSTALDKLMLGEQKVDDYVLQSVNSVKQNALQNYVDLPTNIAMQYIQRDLEPIIRWQTAAKNQYGALKESVGNIIKTYPNINPDIASKLALKTFDDNFFQLDEQGNANPVIPQKPIDYNSLFSDPKVMAGITTNDITPVDKFFHGLDKQGVSGSDYVDRKGNKKSYSWAGVQTRFSQPVTDSDGKVIGFEAKYDTIDGVTDSKGKVLKLATPEMMTQVINTPGLNNSMYKLWEDYKDAHQIGNLDESTEKALFRNFVWKEFNNRLPQGVTIKETEATPKDRVSNNFFIGGQQPIVDVYKEVDDLATSNDKVSKGQGAPLNELSIPSQNIILNIANKATGLDLTQADIYIKKYKDGTIHIINAEDNSDIGKVDYTDLNTAANPNAVDRRNVIRNDAANNPTPKPKPAQKSTNNIPTFLQPKK